MNHSSDNANVVTGTKRALESTQIGRETKVVTNTKQTPLTNMKKEETTNKLKNKNTSNKGSNNLSSRRETNLNDASNKRFYKPLNIPVTIPKIIDSSSINSPRNSFFGSQIEAIMFAFGECRYVTSDVLQLMEETVRQFNLFLINRILERKRVEESRQEIQLNLSDIVGLIQKDNRLTRRTCAFVKSIGASLDEKHNWKDYSDDNYSVIRRLLVPCTERMETVSVHETSHGPCKESVNDVSQNNNSCDPQQHDKVELNQSLVSATSSESKPKPTYSAVTERLINNVDIMTLLVNKAAASLSQVFSQTLYREYSYCRKVTLTTSPSQQPSSVPDRANYFLQWLRTAQSGIQLENTAIHALGYLSWEVIGLITQTSLMLRYGSLSSKMNRLGNHLIGYKDPRRLYCNTAQQFILALRHGLGTWLVLPTNDEELRSITTELERKSSMGDRLPFDISNWRVKTISQLQVFHVLDTLRFLRDIRRNGTYSSVLVNLFGDSLLGRL